MDISRAEVAHGDDGVGIPDDLRCKRSDGKQWRCTAMSMPDKTVCEKHYIQAKKRAANSALRASLKKAKRKSGDDSPVYLESKSDDKDMSPMDVDGQECPVSSPLMKPIDKFVRSDIVASPESSPLKSLSARQPLNDLNLEDDIQEDSDHFDESQRSYRASPSYAVEASNMSHKSLDNGATGTSEDHSDADTDSSSDTGGLICHQCRRTDKGSVIWCLKCDRRGYCGSCISSQYSNIPSEEIQRMCPACRGSCNCKVCSKVDNMLKARIRDIPVLDKLQYLYCLLSSVLPIVKQIHQQQCAEVELEKKLRGIEVDLERTKFNADEQMCWVPIVDYHRHCSNCTYDLCLSCCQDLREATLDSVEDGAVDYYSSEVNFYGETSKKQQTPPRHRLFFSTKFPGWRANTDGSVPCLPTEHGGCGFSYLTLRRIFKMNWVAKLVKNLEEMVSGCKVNGTCVPSGTGSFKSKFLQCANRKDSTDNFLYCPSAQDINSDGVDFFRNHWAKGEPVLVKHVCDVPSSTSWDPMVIWRDICETSEERMNDAGKLVKAIDCLDWSEVEIHLEQFMKGYSEGRIREDGRPQLLKLKDWPSPSASEEFFLYQRPEFISKVPFLEFIHSKWGLLNVAAKLPHYSLQNDVGPKIFISYGLFDELGRGDAVANLHTNVRDMVYVLVHSCEVKNKVWQHGAIDKMEKAVGYPEAEDSSGESCRGLKEEASLDLSVNGGDRQEVCRGKRDINLSEPIEETEGQSIDLENESRENGGIYSNTRPGIIWDVFRREDISKLIKYLRAHWKEFGMSDTEHDNLVANPLHDDVVYLRSHHKAMLKEEFGVEPWTFEQHLGQAVFVPAGCPFQVRNLQSTVQLGLDFLSPESLEQAVKLSEEIRSLPNDHATKLQMVEVGKISLYAASSAIKEVQKLVLDQKLAAELVFEDRNLTAMVSENLEKMIKQRQIACA